MRTIVLGLAALALCGVRGAGAQTDDKKIAEALQAGPDFITKDATVLDYPSSPGGQFRVLRKGTSEWTCFPGGDYEPACFDRVFFKFMQESLSGQTPHIDKVGYAYMYFGELLPNVAGKSETSNPRYRVGPHVMILFPHQEDLQALNHEGSAGLPYVNHLKGHTELFLVMPFEHCDQSLPVTEPCATTIK